MTLLLKEVNNDVCKLLDLVRKLNARQEYARLAQMMLGDIFSRVDPDELLSALKKDSKVKHWEELMDSCEIYGLKHYARADKNLKQSFYLQYVMSQMTLQADTQKAKEVPPRKKKRDAKAQAKREVKNLF